MSVSYGMVMMEWIGDGDGMGVDSRLMPRSFTELGGVNMMVPGQGVTLVHSTAEVVNLGNRGSY